MKVAVLGVGLIGGSIGLAARRRAGAHVSGYDPDAHVLSQALRSGAIDELAPDVASAVSAADVVFVAAPVGATAQIALAALQAVGTGCVVSDVGSTKREIVRAVGDRRFVGGHPLAGAETAGFEHAREDLFDGAAWYLTPRVDTRADPLERLCGLIERFGASPAAIDADAHDRLMARVSHLPHVLANVLVAQVTGAFADADSTASAVTLHGDAAGAPESAAGVSESPAGAPEFAAGATRRPVLRVGPSFRDATRVAGANTAVWTDIYISNRDALGEAIGEAIERLKDIRGVLADGDAGALSAWNEQARGEREKLWRADGPAGS